MSSDLRRALSDLLGRAIPADEELDDTAEAVREFTTALHRDYVPVARLQDLADWHDTKVEKARAFPGLEPVDSGSSYARRAAAARNRARTIVMEKAAEVHTDAARRLRRIVSLQRGDE